MTFKASRHLPLKSFLMNFISKYCKLYKQSSPNQMRRKIQTSNWRLLLPSFHFKDCKLYKQCFPNLPIKWDEKTNYRLTFTACYRAFSSSFYKQLLITKCSSAIKLVTAQLLKGVSCERIALGNPEVSKYLYFLLSCSTKVTCSKKPWHSFQDWEMNKSKKHFV